MVPSGREVERYRDSLAAVRGEAERYVRSRVLSECPGLAVADAREAAKGVVADAVDVYGPQAQALACDLFDEVMEASGEDVRARLMDGLTDLADVDAKVRYFAGKLVKGDLAGFAGDCASRAGFYVWREAMVCTARNVEDAQ